VIKNLLNTTHFAVSAPTTSNAGSLFSVTVTAQDASNLTVASYRGNVHFSSSDIQAGLPADYRFTAADNGVHTFNNVVLKTANSQTITVSDTYFTAITGKATVTVSPLAASTLTVSDLISPSIAGTQETVTVSAKDQFGNIATSYLGKLHFKSSDGNASLPVDYTFVGSDNGVHTFTNGVTLRTAGSQTVTATDTVTSSITGNQVVTVNPAAAAIFSVTGFLSPITAGIASSFTVTALDAFNNIATGYLGTVHFKSSDLQAVLPSDYTFVAGDNGVHTFSGTLKTAGSQTLTATDTVTSSITGKQVVTVNPAAASVLSVTGPGTGTAGVAFTVTVTAQDPFGNTATAYLGTVHFTTDDPHATLPADYKFVSGDNGVHTFSNGVTLVRAGGNAVTATDTVTSTITGKTSVTVSPAAVAHFLVTGLPFLGTAGTLETFTVTVIDAFRNIVPTYVGTVNFSSNDTKATLPNPMCSPSGMPVCTPLPTCWPSRPLARRPWRPSTP
jgi:hypothetical protein